MKGTISVILADDHPVFLEGLMAVLRRESGVAVLETAGDGQAALDAAKRSTPDILLLDVEMPRLTGLEVARLRRQEGLAFEIILLTIHRDENLFNEAMDLGVKGFLLKESAAVDIVHAIQQVAAGRFFVSPILTEYLIERSAQIRRLSQAHPGIDQLTGAERRVLKLIATDMTTKEIADRLKLSPRTIESHRAKISRKLGLQGSHSLLKFAFEHRSSL